MVKIKKISQITEKKRKMHASELTLRMMGQRYVQRIIRIDRPGEHVATLVLRWGGSRWKYWQGVNDTQRATGNRRRYPKSRIPRERRRARLPQS